MNCLLCDSSRTKKINIDLEDKYYFNCCECELIFLSPEFRLTSEEEKKRYEEHNNDVNDKRYQLFVSPLVEEIKKKYLPSSLGLDFGAGTGPVIAYLLNKEGYKVNLYDPFFHNEKEVLNEKYDYIVSCEVIEHFFFPKLEFIKFRELLNNRGTLFLNTQIYSIDNDFNSWWYRKDPTHVTFYTQRTIEWIKNKFNFENLEIKKNKIIILN